MIIHKVKDETLEEISLRYKIPKSAILNYNKISDINLGDYIVIPKISGRFYKVQPFDTLEKISKKFDVTVHEILKKNNITKIFPFMEIII